DVGHVASPAADRGRVAAGQVVTPAADRGILEGHVVSPAADRGIGAAAHVVVPAADRGERPLGQVVLAAADPHWISLFCAPATSLCAPVRSLGLSARSSL